MTPAMKKNLDFILLRLSEESTWQAIGKLVASVGAAFSIQFSSALPVEIGLGGAIISFAISAFMPELGSAVTVDPDQIAAAVRAGIAQHEAMKAAQTTEIAKP